MAHDEHHEHLMAEVEDMLEPVLSGSPQAVYVYLDDSHKICNQKFADMLGYPSIDEWIANETPVDDVLEADQNEVIEAYAAASDNFEASSLSVTLKTRDEKELKVNLVMVPFTYKDEVFVLHFISRKELN